VEAGGADRLSHVPCIDKRPNNANWLTNIQQKPQNYRVFNTMVDQFGEPMA